MKFDTGVLSESQSRLFKFHKNLTRITDASHKDLRMCMTKSCSVVLRMRNVADTSCRENKNTDFYIQITFYF